MNYFFLIAHEIGQKKTKKKTHPQTQKNIPNAGCLWWCREMDVSTWRGSFVIGTGSLEGSLAINIKNSACDYFLSS